MPVNEARAKYRKGRAREYRSMQLFKSAGYECLRSARSHGAFDIAAFSKANLVLCQVKLGRWPSAVEMESLRRFPAPPHTRKLVHRWEAGKRLPEIREIN